MLHGKNELELSSCYPLTWDMYFSYYPRPHYSILSHTHLASLFNYLSGPPFYELIKQKLLLGNQEVFIGSLLYFYEIVRCCGRSKRYSHPNEEESNMFNNLKYSLEKTTGQQKNSEKGTSLVLLVIRLLYLIASVFSEKEKKHFSFMKRKFLGNLECSCLIHLSV